MGAKRYGLAGLVLVLACLLCSVNANDIYFRVSVVDCNNRAAVGAFVSVSGCTDQADTTPAVTPASSKVIVPVNANTFAGAEITENLYCPDAWGPPKNFGIKVDYCSGSSQRPCSLSVMKLNPDGVTYSQDLNYAPKVGLWDLTSLQDYVLNTRDPTDPAKYLYQTIYVPNETVAPGSQLRCPGPFPVCSYLVYHFKPTPGVCP